MDPEERSVVDSHLAPVLTVDRKQQYKQELRLHACITCSVFAPGFNPRWDCTFNFTIHVPDLALVRFMVEDHDYTSSNDFLGQFTLPFTSLRTGECWDGGVGSRGSAGGRRHENKLCSPNLRIFDLCRLPSCPTAEAGWLQSFTLFALHPRQGRPLSEQPLQTFV